LTRASFHLEGDRPTVKVEAAYSKHRREDTLPLRTDTSIDLQGFLSAKLPGAAAFAIPNNPHLAMDMWQADLESAREAWISDATLPQERKKREGSSFLCYCDSAGRFADFHALRHTCGSLLASTGAHPKVAQSIMRHSSIELTMSRYSHVYAGQEAGAVAALPNLDTAPTRQSAKATGTDTKADPVFAICLAKQSEKMRTTANRSEQNLARADNEQSPVNIGETQRLQGFSQLREEGLEPSTYALKVRCSAN